MAIGSVIRNSITLKCLDISECSLGDRAGGLLKTSTRPTLS
jgi:hypothetical protein